VEEERSSRTGEYVTTQERTIAIVVAILGVFGGAAAYLSIRGIGDRAHALHIIAFFSLYSVVISAMYPLFFNAPPVLVRCSLSCAQAST
jgi:hypothetical protein